MPEAAPDWVSGAATMTAVVKGATTSAMPTDISTIGTTTPSQKSATLKASPAAES